MSDNNYLPKVKVKRSSAGLGLFACEEILAGQLVVEYTGERITEYEANKRGGKYLFEVTDTITIDGKGRENIARYINHSCNPNCEAEHEENENRIFIRACTNIPKGEELTYNYGKMYMEDIIGPAGCKCKKCL